MRRERRRSRSGRPRRRRSRASRSARSWRTHRRRAPARRAGLVLVALLVACGSGGGVPDRFSGTWRLGDGRTIPIRRVSGREGEAALRRLRGRPCAQPAVYFRATYFDGIAHMAGCARGDGKLLRARFDDNGIRGELDQRLTADDRFVGTVRGDGHAPFRIVARRLR